MMKYIATILILLSISTLGFARSSKVLTSYQEVLKVITQGGHLQAVSNLKTCSPAATDGIQLGTVAFDHFLIYSAEKDGKKIDIVGTSNTILVSKKEGYRLEYVKLRIFSDNSVEFFQQYLNPTDYSPLQKGSSFTCHLNNKKDSLEGITLYGQTEADLD